MTTKILLIDDEEWQIRDLRAALCALGYVVEYANSGRAGARAVIAAMQSSEPYAVVISDWQMGDRTWHGAYVLLRVAMDARRYDAALPVRILRTRTPHEVRERHPDFPEEIPIVSKDAPLAEIMALLPPLP